VRASGGGGVALSFFDQEDSRARKAKQQRMARQIEQRRRLTREKARPEEPAGRPRPGEEAGPPAESPALHPLQSPSAPRLTPANSVAGTPRRPSISSQPSLALAHAHDRDAWDLWPVKAAPEAAAGTPHQLPLDRDDLASPASRTPASAPLRRPLLPSKDCQLGSDSPAVPSLHDRFASLRDEMKRQRAPADQLQSARAAESALSALMQQRSTSRLHAVGRSQRREC